MLFGRLKHFTSKGEVVFVEQGIERKAALDASIVKTTHDLLKVGHIK